MEDNSVKIPTVRSIGIKFGLISAGFSIFFFLVVTLIGMNPFDRALSWVSLVVSIVILVLAHKQFKDQGDGFMTFGQGFGIGFWITVVALLIGGLFTFVYAGFIDPTVMDGVYEAQRLEMEEKGMPDEQIDVAITWTKKLFWPFYFGIGLFFGVLLALIVSIFTQKKNPQPAF